ncbi:unnamed protein product [Microthlaspi erraticum]|uniref:Uncharacterized protein n=1 Tax=Microthlaspi erraticum TaxID=1685480 RepID=A0A6D2KK54_9BRAS|nr:unnamed protein product [Microthlaspi erraticum]
MLHGIGSGYTEAEAFGNGEASFSKNLGSGKLIQRFQFTKISLPTPVRAVPLRTQTPYFPNHDCLMIPVPRDSGSSRFRFRSGIRVFIGASVHRS